MINTTTKQVLKKQITLKRDEKSFGKEKLRKGFVEDINSK